MLRMLSHVLERQRLDVNKSCWEKATHISALSAFGIPRGRKPSSIDLVPSMPSNHSVQR